MSNSKSDQLYDVLKVSKIDADPFESIEASIRRMSESHESSDPSQYVNEWELHDEARKYSEEMAAFIREKDLFGYVASMENSIFDDSSNVTDDCSDLSTSSFDGTGVFVI